MSNRSGADNARDGKEELISGLTPDSSAHRGPRRRRSSSVVIRSAARAGARSFVVSAGEVRSCRAYAGQTRRYINRAGQFPGSAQGVGKASLTEASCVLKAKSSNGSDSLPPS